MPEPLIADNLAMLDGIAHGFFTRHGGVSAGIYASLNCGLGSRDERHAVLENRRRVAARLQAKSIVTTHQVHGTTVAVVDVPWPDGKGPEADAIVTMQPGLAVCALTADCAPVLFADAQTRIVAAAHAGWRGAKNGVLEATIAAMEKLGAERRHICAAVGPCIGPEAYEVGQEFADAFLRDDAQNRRFFAFSKAGGRPYFDLSAYAIDRLARSGLSILSRSMPCTYTSQADFFSYRRSQARKELDYGRQISAIVLT
jgi:hypothetical protein